jgi:hypothetical protein
MHRRPQRRAPVPRSPRVAALTAACAVLAAAVLAGAAPAGATSVQHEYAVFSDCPLTAIGAEQLCIISTVTGGEFAIGSKTVPINKTITLQGGLAGTTLVPAADGNTLSKTPLQLPGGLAGIELLPTLTEVTATAELAGAATVSVANTTQAHGTAVALPVVVKLDNTFLGSSCYIGSPSEPLQLNLTTGTTSPPGPNQPISGSPGKLVLGAGEGQIATLQGLSLADNAFAAPGVNGCAGVLSLLIDPLVDIDAGLPAAAGHNTAVMNGGVILTEARLVREWAALPELGRCSKAPFEIVERERVYRGSWYNASCTFESRGGKFGLFEWSEGAGAKKKFKIGAGTTLLSTKTGTALSCAKATGGGEYSGTKTTSLTLTLTACKAPASKASCHSAGAAAGEIVMGALEGKLGFIEDRSVESNVFTSVGIDISSGSTLLSAECGTQKLSVTGSAIGVLTPFDAMSGSFALTFTQAAGAQQPEAFEEEPKDVLSLSVGGGSPEAAGLSAKVKLVDEEKLAVKAEA